MLKIRQEDLGVIRFKSTPRGGVPEEIREQWIGVEVPCLFSHDGIPIGNDTTHDALSDVEIPDYPGYMVLQSHALQALEKKSPDAAAYWNSLGYPNHATALFLFDSECVEVITPVLTRRKFWQRYADA
jgi:hypothetical protein